MPCFQFPSELQPTSLWNATIQVSADLQIKGILLSIVKSIIYSRSSMTMPTDCERSYYVTSSLPMSWLSWEEVLIRGNTWRHKSQNSTHFGNEATVFIGVHSNSEALHRWCLKNIFESSKLKRVLPFQKDLGNLLKEEAEVWWYLGESLGGKGSFQYRVQLRGNAILTCVSLQAGLAYIVPQSRLWDCFKGNVCALILGICF